MTTFETYAKQLTAWLHVNPHWAGLMTFIIAFIESLAIVGTLIPGSVTMTAIGMLAGSGVISLFSTLCFAILGAFVGDGTSFWLGAHFHEELRNIWPFKAHPMLLSKGQEFFNRHGAKSIILGRFVGPFRSMIPVVAGMMYMPTPRFLVANLIAGICWSIIYILPGVFIGAATSELSPKATTFLIVLVLVILFSLWFISGLIKLFTLWFIKFLNGHVDSFWKWMRKHQHLKGFAMYISDPRNPESYGQLGLCLLLMTCGLLFILLASTINTAFIKHLNDAAFYMLMSYHTRYLDELFVAITLCGEKTVIVTVYLAIGIYFCVQKYWRTARYWFLNGLIAIAVVSLLRHFITFTRPDIVMNIRQPYSSFLSGHIALPIAILGFFAYLSASLLKNALRRFIYLPIITLLLLISLSRVYLGVQWLSDVLASILLGNAILIFSIIVYRRKINPTLALAPLLLIFMLCYTAVYTTFLYTHFSAEDKAYTPKYKIIVLPYQTWWKTSNTPLLPLYRLNRLGEPTAILNIQWAAPLDEIKKILLQHGWQQPEENSVVNFINRLAPKDEHQHLPLLPQLYMNHPPVLTLVKKIAANKPILVLNLWKSFYLFGDYDMPLWIGSIHYLTSTKWHTKKLQNLLDLPPPLTFLQDETSKYLVKQKSYDSHVKLHNSNAIQVPPTVMLIKQKK